jgi:hypothetical protein
MQIASDEYTKQDVQASCAGPSEEGNDEFIVVDGEDKGKVMGANLGGLHLNFVTHVSS